MFLVVGCRYWPTYAPMDVRLPHELNVYQVQYTLHDRCFSCWHRQCALCNCLTLDFLFFVFAIGYFQRVLLEQVQR